MALSNCKKLVLCLLLLMVAALSSCLPLSPVEAKERAIESRLSLEIESASVPFLEKLTGKPCTDDQQRMHALEALESVFGAYPLTLSRIAKIKHVYICAELTSFVTPVAGVTVNRGDHCDIYMNAAFLHSMDYLTRTLHHELFHAIEFAHPFDNEKWRNLNPYEPYLEDTIPKGQVLYYDPLSAPAFEPGFVSEYARVRPREDRAELFAQVMQSRSLPRTRAAFAAEDAMLQGDSILQKKLDNLCAYLDALFNCTNNIWDEQAAAFKQPLLYAQSLYIPKDGAQLRSGPSNSYPLLPAEGILLYVGKSRAEKGDRLLILLGENGQRVYAREKELTPLQDFDYQSALAAKGIQVVTAPGPADDVLYRTVPTVGDRIDDANFISGGTLAIAACMQLNRALQQEENPAFSYFSPVLSLTYRNETCAYLLLGDTLYVDVERCTGMQLKNALYTQEQVT